MKAKIKDFIKEVYFCLSLIVLACGAEGLVEDGKFLLMLAVMVNFVIASCVANTISLEGCCD